MLRKLIDRRLAAEEEALGVSFDYLRHLTQHALPAFFKFMRFLGLAGYQRVAPAAATYIARVVSARREDCGPCTQIVVAMARREGVPAVFLRAALTDHPEDLPPALADAYHFARAVLSQTGEEEEYRERIRAHYGEEGLIELALALATTPVFTLTKRALGYAKACTLVEIELGSGSTLHTTALPAPFLERQPQRDTWRTPA